MWMLRAACRQVQEAQPLTIHLTMIIPCSAKVFLSIKNRICSL